MNSNTLGPPTMAMMTVSRLISMPNVTVMARMVETGRMNRGK